MVECNPGRLDIPPCETQLYSRAEKQAEGVAVHQERSCGSPVAGPQGCMSLPVCLPLWPSQPAAEGLLNRYLILLKSGLLWLLIGTERVGIRAFSLQSAQHAPCRTVLSRLIRLTRSPPSAQPTAAVGSPAPASTGSST